MPRHPMWTLLLMALVAAGLSLPFNGAPLAKESPARGQGLSDDTVVATIDGKDITIGDLADRKIYELRKDLHQALLGKLTERSIALLSKRGKGFGANLEREIPEAELRLFYERNQLRSRGSFQSMAPRIRSYLKKQYRQRKISEAFRRAKLSGLVKVYLSLPKEFLVSLSIGDSYVSGNPKARVMFMEFTDYQ